jgi:ABC-type transporter Mla subunit MlaD
MVAASLDMLEESLVKKNDILGKLQEENEKQKEILESLDEEREPEFDATIDRKAELIDQLGNLDEGFQSLFDRIKEEVGQSKDQYKDQIKKMQELIEQVTAKSASVEAAEHRNKRLADKYFSSIRQKMNESRQASAAAFNYYRTMNNFKDIPPQFLDNKN